MAKIEMHGGIAVLVDDEDFAWLNQFTWSVVKGRGGHSFAVRRVRSGGKSVAILMQREILELEDPKLRVNFLNRDTLDCRRENLRIASYSQMSAHQPKSQFAGKRPTSPFKGVSRNAGQTKWKAQICVNRRMIRLGCFPSEKEAAQAYAAAAEEHFGEFASY